MENHSWETHKSEIEQLYLHEGKTLEQLRQFMAEKRGFRKTKDQYSRVFKRWQFKKYRGGSAKWKAIGSHLARRGRESEVFIDGVLCSPSKVKYEVRRHGFQTTMEQLTSQTNPSTPEGVVICSPGPSSWTVEWSSNLPWISFSRVISSMNLQGFTWPTQSVNRPVSKFTDSSNLPLKNEIGHVLGSLLDWKTTHRLAEIQSKSRTAAVLSVVMPEDIEGRHLAVSEKLCDATEEHLQEFIQVISFLISNNFEVGDEYSKIFIMDTDHVSSKDRLILKVLHLCGLDNATSLRQLLGLNEPTAEAIAENLLASALRSSSMKLVDTMLLAGVKPHIIESNGDVISPLQFAAHIRDPSKSVEMAMLLLSHYPDMNQDDYTRFVFMSAANRGNERLMDILIFNGSQIPPWSLEAILQQNPPSDTMSRLERVLDMGESLESRILWDETYITMIAVAVLENRMALAHMLICRGADVNAMQPVLFDDRIYETTALGIAASMGNHPMMHFLIANFANVNQSDNSEELIPPLLWAVINSQRIAVELLLRVGADVFAANQSSTNFDDTNKTLMNRALDTNDMKICTALYTSGVVMDDETSATYRSRLMFEYVKKDDTNAVSCLLSAGAEVNEIHEDDPDTALGAAIQQGSSDMILLLRGAGANVFGRRIRFIPNVETARCLKTLGMLEEVLRDNGDVMLASGVFANDKDLAIFVFKNGGKWGRCAYEELLRTRVEMGIKNGDLENLQRMHRAGVRPRPGMIMSIGSLQTARYLDEATLLSEILIQNGDEILISAILAENEPLVSFLLEKEADQNASNYLEYELKVRSCQSPLEASLIRVNLQLAHVLISRGALITQKEIMTAAWEALRRGEDSIMGRFLDMFPPSFYAAPGAIGLAIQLRRFELAHLILRSGIDPRGELSLSERLKREVSHHLNESGWWCVEDQKEPSETALDIAVRAGNRATLQMLLMSAVWTKEARGRAFTLSMQCKRMDLVQDLWTSDTDVSQELSESYGSSSTPLQISIQWRDVPLMNRLIAAGANIDQLSTHGGYTPLQQATREGTQEIVENLIAAGANVNSPPNPRKGATALQLAVKQGNVELMELLLDNGAEVNQAPAYQAGATALQFAAIRGYIGIVRKLLEAGAAIRAPRSRIYGRTATEGAAEHGRIDVLQLFLNEEVSFEGDFRTEYIRSVKLAEQNGHRAAANLIKSKIGWTIWDREQLQDEAFDYKEIQVLQLKTL